MPTPSAAAASAIRTQPQVGTPSESFSLPEAGTTPTLVVSLLVVCAGAGAVCVFATVVVGPGVVTVLVEPVPPVCLVVPVVPPADWIAVFALVAAVETACCTVPDPLDPQALTAQAINAPAMSASTILAASLVPAGFKVPSGLAGPMAVDRVFWSDGHGLAAGAARFARMSSIAARSASLIAAPPSLWALATLSASISTNRR